MRLHLDFWNNPLVVSAFRVKYRRGGLFMTTITYLVLLAAGGMALMYWYQRDQDEGQKWAVPWHEAYLLILFGLQLVVSGLIAATTTAASMRAEVMNRTLDFQRCSAISPRQILIGKLFGEAALAYLMAIAIFPLALLCLLLHVEGLDPLTFLLLFVSLFTSILMMGAFGLLNRLVVPAGKTGAGGGNAGIGFLVTLGIVSMQMAGAGGVNWLSRPWSSALIGLLTPIPQLVGLFRHDAWQYGLSFFEFQVPFLLVTPISQLLMAWLCIHTMERRLINPVTPPFGKRTAYVTLFIIDVLAAGVIYGNKFFRWSLTERVGAFCLVHLLASMWLMVSVTPGRDVLESWVWRWRGRRSQLVDWWMNDRAENALVLLSFGLIGLVVGGLCVVLVDMGAAAGVEKPVLAALGVTFLLLLSVGTLYQWLMLLTRRQGLGILLFFLILSNAVPAAIGGYWYSLDREQDNVAHGKPASAPAIATAERANLAWDIVPAYHLIWWLGGRVPVPALTPLIVVYSLLLVGVWYSLRRRMERMQAAIDRKLQSMGVRATNAVPGPAALPAG